METGPINQSLKHHNAFHIAPSGEASSESRVIRDSFIPGAGDEGIGQVFDPNPIVTMKDRTLRDNNDSNEAIPKAAYVKVTLRNLLPGDVLDGPYVSTRITPDRAKDPGHNFVYDRSDDRFSEVMAYYHIDSSQMYIQTLGFDNINSHQVFVNAHGTTDDNSFYIPWENSITFGTGGVDDAEDADIILHEYAHSIIHDQIPELGTTGEMRSVGEGFGDYWSTSAFASKSDGFDKELIGNWDATAYSKDDPPRLRSIESDLTYDDRNGDNYHDGTIWASTLWEIYKKIGKSTLDRIVLESHFALDQTATMKDAARALVMADMSLNKGANLESIIDVLAKKKFFKSKEEPGSLRMSPDAGLPADGKPEDIAQAFFKENMKTGRRDMRRKRTAQGRGADYVHLQQYYRGIPVEGAEASIIVGKSNKVPILFRDGTVSESLLKGTPSKAGVKAGDACRLAGYSLEIPGECPAKEASLVYMRGKDDRFNLAWKVHVPLKDPPGDWRIYVSATDGSIIGKENDIWID